MKPTARRCMALVLAAGLLAPWPADAAWGKPREIAAGADADSANPAADPLF